LPLKENGLKSLKQSKINKRFIYLISPNKIKRSTFYIDLEKIFKLRKVSFFQLRLKNEVNSNKITIGKKIKKICKKYRVKFLVNDEPNLAKKLNADGCHIGQDDMNFFNSRKILKNKKIIGVTCHNSKKLALTAKKNGANYIAFGAFFKSSTKKSTYKANLNILRWSKKKITIPTVAIGGINNSNYKKILLNGANYIACSSYVWNNRNLDPVSAIRQFK
jgi:thiamine-phosphate pyrophosphorylase